MKFKNKKVIFDFKGDISVFDSKLELERAKELLIFEAKGYIDYLERQRKFIILPSLTVFINGKRKSMQSRTYTCDFFYYDYTIEKYVIEEVKSDFTEKDTVYRFRRRSIIENILNHNTVFRENVGGVLKDYAVK